VLFDNLEMRKSSHLINLSFGGLNHILKNMCYLIIWGCGSQSSTRSGNPKQSPDDLRNILSWQTGLLSAYIIKKLALQGLHRALWIY
jgi:hypothetical protein